VGIVRAIVDADIEPTAAIGHAKVNHRFAKSFSQAGTVVAATYYARIVRGATGTILGFRAALTETVATGGDRTVTVDLHKSTGGGAFATVLSATIGFTSGSTLYTVGSGTINSPAIQAGDILKIVITVAGAAGNQALGLIVDLDTTETPA
jgi:hypothetical protein